MNNKSEGSKRTFVPNKIGESLKKINNNFSHKFGKIEYLVHSKWGQIVGPFFSEHSEPLKITRIQTGTYDDNEKITSNYLLVNVSPVAAIEFQHYNDKIIEKINSYFGYKAIEGIKFQQNYSPKNYNKGSVKPKNLILNDELKKEVDKINNKSLEESIVKLGLSIRKEKK